MTVTRVLLHAGQAKTGTTTIQETLAVSRGALRQRGITVWDIAVNHSHPVDRLVDRVVPGREEGHARAMPELTGPRAVRHLDQALRSSLPTFVVSAEHLWEFELGDLAAVRQLVAASAPDARIDVTIYVRRPERQVPSLLQQRLKRGKTLGQTLEDMPLLEYRQRLSYFFEVFGRERVDVRLMPELDEPSDLLSDFAAVLGVPDISWPAMEPRNISFSHAAAHIADAMNAARPPDVPFTGQHRRILLQVRELIGGERYRLTPEVLDEVLARHQDDFEWLRETTGIDLLDPPPSRRPVEPPVVPTFGELGALLQALAQERHEANLRKRAG